MSELGSPERANIWHFGVWPQVGFPLMIKASEGGGGKGIRMVNNMEELRVGYVQVEKEVVGSPIFIQKLGINARHLEVQLVADEYGTAISLYGRDCSVQRRHQKVIEEGPVQVCTQELCRELEAGAVRLANFVNYRSAGTVEFLYSAETKEYSFLEVNPRLQVEHPVTEGITGVCVPAVQLNVAMGIPLAAIPDIREFYLLNPDDTTPIDFQTAQPRPPLCHTVAARITAENPDDGFKPSSGAINELFYRPVKGVSASFSVCGKGAVHQFADSQFGHLFSYGETREEACRNLMMALKEISIRGEIANNTTALQYIISSEKFRTDTHSTGWLDVLIANNEPMAPPVPDMTAVVCGAVVQARALYVAQKGEVLDCLSRGVVPDQSVSGYAHQAFDLIYGDFKYPIGTAVCGDLDGIESSMDITINGGHLQASIVTMHDGGLKVLFGNTSYVLYSERTATGLKVVINGRPCFFPDDADPTALQVPSAGKFLGYLVADGDVVQPGQPYAEIEVMKTVMPLLAQNGPGTVTLLKSAGQALEAGDVLARLTLADGAEVKVAAKYTATFPEQLIYKPEGKSLTELYTAAKAALTSRMDGYGQLFDAGGQLVKCLVDPSLPRAEAAALRPACPAAAAAALDSIAAGGDLAVECSKGLAALIGTADEGGEVFAFFNAYAAGQAMHTVNVITELLQTYITVEAPFDVAANYQDAVHDLRDGNKTDLAKVAGYVLSHSQLVSKNAVVILLLETIQKTKATTEYIESLAALTELAKEPYKAVGQLAKELLFSVDQALRSNAMHARRAKGDSAPVSLNAMGSLSRSNSVNSMSSFDDNQYAAVDTSEVLDVGPIANISVEAIFSVQDKAAQAKAVKEYFETVGVNNAIQSAGGNLVKMQYGNGAAAFVAGDVCMAPAIITKAAADGLLTRVNILLPADCCDEAAVSTMMEDIKGDLEGSELLKVSFTLLAEDATPIYMTFCRRLEFEEDKGWRGTEPALCLQMELDRLCQFDVQLINTSPSQVAAGTPDYRLQTLYAKETTPTAAVDVRMFVRTAVYNSAFFLVPGLAGSSGGSLGESPRGLRRTSSFSSFEVDGNGAPSSISDANVLVDMMRNLELSIGKRPTESNFFFINLIGATTADIESAEATLTHFTTQFLPELKRLKVSTIEVKVGTGRIIAYNAAGSSFKMDRHTDDEISGEAEHPYPVLNRMQRKKLSAQRANSTYIYDFLEIMEDLVCRADPAMMLGVGAKKDDPAFKATELVVNAEGDLEEARRPAGNNDCGMVILKCWMRTAECRMGREFVLIGSDISFQSGSFSPREDIVYFKALELCRQQGIPAVYIAANSGARIGLNDAVKQKLQVAWVDPKDAQKGYDYLYLSDEDYAPLAAQVHAVKTEADGAVRYRIVDVFGGCGVECLRGSGMIATATSAAYDETVTLTYVTGRSVGIGAYISRLSQRIIQHESAPLLLTGAAALNKVLGRQVYSSNAQIGGPKVMHNNGVSHQVVTDDVEGCAAILKWLSYVPAKRGASLPIFPTSDSVERRVEWMPPSGPYDPREMLAGGVVNGEFKRGFFDESSFTEVLSGWGKTVVTGRARLGGLPVGVVAVETRTQEKTLPADPGAPGSTAQVVMQAGNVWFPDSAYKTANSINDFNREGLPLFIFANWRGFAGGPRDMFDEVLKYGSFIVDALRTYKQPVFVYLPCGGELRGGAWVVIDPTINPDMMRMYTSENAKGNVLEPEGIVEIKFRKPDLLKAMKRNDPVYAAMVEGSAEAKAKEKELLPVYTQIAVQFAALHDTPGVMKHKGVVSDVVPWAQSRTYFYGALRTRLAEVALEKEMAKLDPIMPKTAMAAAVEGELAPCVADLASGNTSMADMRIANFMKGVTHKAAAEAVSHMPVDAVLAGLLKDHSPESLVAMLSGKATAHEE